MKHKLLVLLCALLGFSGAAQATATLNVLVAFTSEALTYLGGTAYANAADQINDTNTALGNSGITSVVVSLAGTVTVSQGALAGDMLIATTKNYNILKARRDTRADIVITINSVTTGGGRALAAPATVAEDAFAIVAAQSLYKYDFEHELGHLLGAHHQSAYGASGNDTTSSPSTARGWYLRMPGFWTYAPNEWYAASCAHTIMAYDYNGADGLTCVDYPILFYSTPTASVPYYRNMCATPCNPTYTLGSSTANNAAYIQTAAPSLAAFRNVNLLARYSGGLLQHLLNALDW